MLKQDICLGALTKLGINYDLENYESSESYKVALREFEKNIYNATQNINTELLKKEVILTSAYGIPTIPYFVGGIATSLSAWNNQVTTIQGTNKIHKGTQYAKFNIDKEWAKAQKIIAKLGA